MRTDAEILADMVEHNPRAQAVVESMTRAGIDPVMHVDKIRDLIALGPVVLTEWNGVRMSAKGTIVSGDVYKFRKTPYCAGTVALSGRCKVVEHG